METYTARRPGSPVSGRLFRATRILNHLGYRFGQNGYHRAAPKDCSGQHYQDAEDYAPATPTIRIPENRFLNANFLDGAT